MNNVYQLPGLTLVVIFAFGMVAGLLLAVVITYLHLLTGRQTDKRSRANEERVALQSLAEQPVEIDDTGMLCARCWEDRHPGQIWSLHVGSLCAKHLLTALPKKDWEDQQAYALQSS